MDTHNQTLPLFSFDNSFEHGILQMNESSFSLVGADLVPYFSTVKANNATFSRQSLAFTFRM